MKISIRNAKFSELKRVCYITKLSYKTPYKEKTLITKPHEPQGLEAAFLRKDFFVIVAVVNDKIVAAVKYLVDKNNNLYLYQLAVLKTYRNKGLGQLLISKLEKIAQTKKCKKLLLDCAQEKKLPDYYSKLGFKIDNIKEFHNHHAVYMSKTVKQKNLR